MYQTPGVPSVRKSWQGSVEFDKAASNFPVKL